MHNWIDIFTNSQVDNFYLLDMLQRLVQLWEDEFIFVRNFTELLKQYLKP